MRFRKQSAFLLGFCLAIGLVLAISVMALAENQSHRVSSASNRGGPPAVADMASLSGARAPADVLPASFGRVLEVLGERPEGVPNELLPGALAAANSRQLLANVGTMDADLYAVPTSRGKVCFVFTAGPAGCVDRFRRDEPDVTTMTGASATTVFGLIPDDAVNVRVIVDGFARRPLIAKNAYFLEVAQGRPTAVRVTYQTGRVGETLIPPAPPMPS